MTIEQAWQALSLAGRQLGGGPVEAAKRLGADAYKEVLESMGVKNDFCAPMALGIALGQIMGETVSAQAELAKIEREWMQENGTDEIV
jgi:hypothetical protein